MKVFEFYKRIKILLKADLTTTTSVPSRFVTECDPNPCFNTGICVLNASGQFHGCFCPTSYTGRYCQNNNNCKD